jgi:hypothetical protein
MWVGPTFFPRFRLPKRFLKSEPSRQKRTGCSVGSDSKKLKAEKLYKPEIQGKWDKVYKKPGYNPFEN